MPGRKDVDERVTLTAVRDAFLRGDFERCLALCERYHARGDGDEVEIQLLEARALLPLNRAGQALDVLRRLQPSDDVHDEHLIKTMLTGAAYVKLGQIDRGIELLRNAHASANSAHPTVHADVAVNLGIARYSKRQYTLALEALRTVPEEADIVHARALLYLAWVAWGETDYETAADRFESTLRRIDACRHYDRYVEAYALYGYALLCAELPRLKLWNDISRRIERFDWTASGLALPRFWLSVAASYVTEMLGALDDSRAWASQAEEQAPSPSCRIVALCRQAALFGPYGETAAHRFFVDRARRHYDVLGREDGLRDEYYLPLTLAEEVVQSASFDAAEALLTYYREAQAPRVKEHPDEAKLEAHRSAIEGALYAARGDRTRARRSYLTALHRFQAIGFGRSASIVACRLLPVTDERRYRDYAEQTMRDASPAYWVRARLVQTVAAVPITPAQADVLRLVADGMTNKQIAATRGISFFRARNSVAELLAAFGARNRAELGKIAVARGIVYGPHDDRRGRVG